MYKIIDNNSGETIQCSNHTDMLQAIINGRLIGGKWTPDFGNHSHPQSSIEDELKHLYPNKYIAYDDIPSIFTEEDTEHYKDMLS